MATSPCESACEPPNGSRLSCGRPTRRRKVKWTTVRAPPGAQHSASIRTICARQLQALVRQQLVIRIKCGAGRELSPRHELCDDRLTQGCVELDRDRRAAPVQVVEERPRGGRRRYLTR